MRHLLVVVVALSMCVQLTGCAALFASKSKSVKFTSEPNDAEVIINGQTYGRTPLSVKLSTKADYTVTFRQAGLEDRSFNIGRHVGAGWIILDILGGLFPVIIDAATGSWYSLNDDSLHGVLTTQVTPTDSVAVPSPEPSE